MIEKVQLHKYKNGWHYNENELYEKVNELVGEYNKRNNKLIELLDGRITLVNYKTDDK